MRTFKPVWSFTPGLTYILFSGEDLIHQFHIPRTARSKPFVKGVYPSVDRIPRNQLKIYIQFSEPMVQGRAREFVSMVEMATKETKDVFLDLKQELWNEDGTILTLWLDPGRIKRDLGPNRSLGAPLEDATQYSLRIAGSWPSSAGATLGSTHVKRYLTVPPDRTKPVVNNWEMRLPNAGTREPLLMKFQEPLDFMLAHVAIKIEDSIGELKGRVTLIENESGWNFVPYEKWKPGDYRLVVESRLEDLAGNNLNHLFDHDLWQSDPKGEEKFYYRDFVLN